MPNRLRFYSETMPEKFIDISSKLDEKLFDIDELLNSSGRTGLGNSGILAWIRCFRSNFWNGGTDESVEEMFHLLIANAVLRNDHFAIECKMSR
jgi:hypothetical protein